jgi:hypothetical protein
MKQQVIPNPRRSDCPGSFRFPQSMGTVFKMYPFYGKHFTQTPSPQMELFLVCNSLCLIFKVLASFRFLFVRSSVASDPLIRSYVLYNPLNPCNIKIMYQNCKPINPARDSSRHSASPECLASRGLAKKLVSSEYPS